MLTPPTQVENYFLILPLFVSILFFPLKLAFNNQKLFYTFTITDQYYHCWAPLILGVSPLKLRVPPDMNVRYLVKKVLEKLKKLFSY